MSIRFFHLFKLQFLCAFVLPILVCPFAPAAAGAGARPDEDTSSAREGNPFHQAGAFITGKAISTKI